MTNLHFILKLDISKSNKIYHTKNVEHLYKPEIIELVRLFTDVRGAGGTAKCLINESRMIFTSKKSNVTKIQFWSILCSIKWAKFGGYRREGGELGQVRW